MGSMKLTKLSQVGFLKVSEIQAQNALKVNTQKNKQGKWNVMRTKGDIMKFSEISCIFN